MILGSAPQKRMANLLLVLFAFSVWFVFDLGERREREGGGGGNNVNRPAIYEPRNTRPRDVDMTCREFLSSVFAVNLRSNSCLCSIFWLFWPIIYNKCVFICDAFCVRWDRRKGIAPIFFYRATSAGLCPLRFVASGVWWYPAGSKEMPRRPVSGRAKTNQKISSQALLFSFSD